MGVYVNTDEEISKIECDRLLYGCVGEDNLSGILSRYGKSPLSYKEAI